MFGVDIIRKPDPVPEGLKRIYEVCALEGKLVVVVSEGVVYNGYLIQHAGSTFSAIQERVRSDDYPIESGPDPAAPPSSPDPELLEHKRIQWWPEAVVCSNCDATVELKEEPTAYVVECPFCTHMIVIQPIADADDNAPMTRAQFNELLDNTADRVAGEAVKEAALGRSPKVEETIKKAASNAVNKARTGASAEEIAEGLKEDLVAPSPAGFIEVKPEGDDLARYEARDCKETVDRIIAEEDGRAVCSGCNGYDGKHTRPDCNGEFIKTLPADLAELDKEIAESESRGT